MENLFIALFGEDFANRIKPLYKKLKDNNFNLILALKSIDLTDILSIISSFLTIFVKNNGDGSVGTIPVSPKQYQNEQKSKTFNIRKIANKEIYLSLSKYFNNNK